MGGEQLAALRTRIDMLTVFLSAAHPQSSSEASDDSDDEYLSNEKSLGVYREPLSSRIAALADIVPPSTRRSISSAASKAYGVASLGGRFAGKAMWVVATTALLVGLPYSLAVEDEARFVQQEREFQQQQSGAQMLGGTVGQPQGQGQQGGGGQGGEIRPPGF